MRDDAPAAEGMIFAAGLGTRLRPLTDRIPKALVRVGGITLLERTVRALGVAVVRVVINVHHHAGQVEREVERLRALGGVPELCLSPEPEGPLETGGGLVRAAPLFRGDGPILLHNVDVISGVDLAALAAAQAAVEGAGCVATLGVARRDTSRYLLFDERGLWGREDRRAGEIERARAPEGGVRRLAFSGLQAVSRRLPALLPGGGVFSIVDAYLELAARGLRIQPWEIRNAPWLEVGTPERLARARDLLGT